MQKKKKHKIRLGFICCSKWESFFVWQHQFDFHGKGEFVVHLMISKTEAIFFDSNHFSNCIQNIVAYRNSNKSFCLSSSVVGMLTFWLRNLYFARKFGVYPRTQSYPLSICKSDAHFLITQYTNFVFSSIWPFFLCRSHNGHVFYHLNALFVNSVIYRTLMTCKCSCICVCLCVFTFRQIEVNQTNE